MDAVEYKHLPHGDLKAVDLSGVDVLLLCHPIHNRGLSITDVTNALYDDFLPKAKKRLGIYSFTFFFILFVLVLMIDNTNIEH